MYLELGCGKGVSTCRMALEDPAHNYLAVDLITSVLGVARRNAEEAYRGVREVDNLILTNFHIEYIYKYLSGQDRVERIYISFCNPWDKRPKQAKHRLTHPHQLRQYRAFLEDGGEIWFKTDDDRLFEDSVEYFKNTGFEIAYQTRDLHASGFTPNYESEHEKMFDAKGVPDQVPDRRQAASGRRSLPRIPPRRRPAVYLKEGSFMAIRRISPLLLLLLLVSLLSPALGEEMRYTLDDFAVYLEWQPKMTFADEFLTTVTLEVFEEGRFPRSRPFWNAFRRWRREKEPAANAT